VNGPRTSKHVSVTLPDTGAVELLKEQAREPKVTVVSVGSADAAEGRATVRVTRPVTAAERADGEMSETSAVALASYENVDEPYPFTTTASPAAAACAPVSQMMLLAFAESTAQATPPTVTVFAAATAIKPVPVMESCVPPAVDPTAGETERTVPTYCTALTAPLAYCAAPLPWTMTLTSCPPAGAFGSVQETDVAVAAVTAHADAFAPRPIHTLIWAVSETNPVPSIVSVLRYAPVVGEMDGTDGVNDAT
jgi:hypothetical protein